MATRTPFFSTKIFRLPRIGPVVTVSSVRAGMSAISRLLFLRRCQPDQVQRVGGSCLPLKRGSALPRGRFVSRLGSRRRLAADAVVLALRCLLLGGAQRAVLVAVEALEIGQGRGAKLFFGDIAVLVGIEPVEERLGVRRVRRRQLRPRVELGAADRSVA